MSSRAEAVGKIVANDKRNCKRQKFPKDLPALFEGRALLSVLWKDLLIWDQEIFVPCWAQRGTEVPSAGCFVLVTWPKGLSLREESCCQR